MVDLDTDAPNGAPPPPGDAKLPSTPSHDGGVEGGSVAFSSSSKETAGSSWDQPLTIESDDEAVELISTPCGDANPDRRIREVCLMIQKDMTPFGLEVLIFCQQTVLKDCPKARSGGAALAAACVLQVPQETLVEWMRDAEKLFASEVPIAWLDATRPETFRKWLDVARRRSPTALALVPRDAAGDAQLAAQMCKEEHSLLGYAPAKSNARPNAAVMELLRWLILDTPRPQMAFCYLKLKPIFEEGGVMLDGEMPPTWASQWEERASKVTSDSFWWFGQGGEMPSAGALVREQTAAGERYTHAARERLVCLHAFTRVKTCRGPFGSFRYMCSVCRLEPEARLRDYCPWAKVGCRTNRRCIQCTGEDGRKNKPIHGRDQSGRARPSEKAPCPGGCIGRFGKPRSNHACRHGFAEREDDAAAQLAWCKDRFNKKNSPTTG